MMNIPEFVLKKFLVFFFFFFFFLWDAQKVQHRDNWFIDLVVYV